MRKREEESCEKDAICIFKINPPPFYLVEGFSVYILKRVNLSSSEILSFATDFSSK